MITKEKAIGTLKGVYHFFGVERDPENDYKMLGQGHPVLLPDGIMILGKRVLILDRETNPVGSMKLRMYYRRN